METSEKTIDVLNDLVKINNDRIAGFENASENLEDDSMGLRPVFNKLAGESNNNVAELSAKVRQFNGEAEEGTTSVSGTLHRAWIDVKATFTGHDLESILEECERGEDAVKSAYRSALEDSNELPYEIVQLLKTQQQGIIEGHDLIKSLRDQARYNNETPDNDEITDYRDDVSIDDHERDDKVADFPPFASNEAPGNPGAADDLMDENELALANEVPSPSFDRSATGRGPVDVGEYQRPDENGAEIFDEKAFEPAGATVQSRSVSSDSKLQEFFVNELKDLLWAENKLVDTLPKMEGAATSVQLREAFHNHLAETEGHVQRLEQIFDMLGLQPDTTKCEAMDGIVDEGEEIIDETDEGTASRDVGLIFAGQKAEHYEIASYGGMVSLAKTLGYEQAAAVLTTILNEEKAADALLTEIAENNVNYQAANEPQEKGLFS